MNKKEKLEQNKFDKHTFSDHSILQSKLFVNF